MSKSCKALFAYQAQTNSELTINPDDLLTIVKDDGEWWLVQNNSGQQGYIPSNYVEAVAAPAAQSGYNGLGGLFGGGDQAQTQAKPGVEICVALHEYQAGRQDELSLTQGLEIEILSKSDDGWWMGRANGRDGWFPHNFVEVKAGAAASSASAGSVSQGGNDLSNINFGAAAPKAAATSSNQPLKSDVLHIVKALYEFQGQAGEVTLRPDMRLEIIEKTNAEWWRARVPETGETGLIPFNYVEVLPDQPSQTVVGGSFTSSSNLQDKPYFKGPIGRRGAEEILGLCRPGQFLVRTSESNPRADQYSISVKGAVKFRHFSTKFEGGSWKIGQKQFSSFDQLIDHYKRLPIFVDNSEQLKLSDPVN